MRRAKEKTKKKKRGSLATCDFRSIAPAVAPKVGEYTHSSRGGGSRRGEERDTRLMNMGVE